MHDEVKQCYLRELTLYSGRVGPSQKRTTRKAALSESCLDTAFSKSSHA